MDPHSRMPLGRRSIPACAGEPLEQCRSLQEGLSPRVRGNPRIEAMVPSGNRSIPACAGEPRLQRRDRRRVYPRVCGGTGRLALRAGSAVSIRSIPACAGEPGYIQRLPALWGLSPRVRGNRSPGKIRPKPSVGLSPRVRGNRWILVHLSLYRDPRVCGGTGRNEVSIPACAGEPTLARYRAAAKKQVYPRVCGGTLHI